MPFKAVPTTVDFPTLEREILQWWKDTDAFNKLRRLRASSGKHFSFLDGPITANNPMGVHHAWGRTYKDLWQRYYAMKGYNQRWQNGFDCQGLWVEVNVEKDLGFTNKRDIEAFGIAEFVNLCKQRVLTYAARQTEQSVRLGMWRGWNDPDGLPRPREPRRSAAMWACGAWPARTTSCRGSRRRSPARAIASWPGRRSARTRAPASS